MSARIGAKLIILFVAGLAIGLLATGMVFANPLGIRFDADKSGTIDKEEAREAITAYFLGTLTNEEAREIITLYFTGESFPTTAPAPIADESPQTVTEVVKRVRPSVVRISTPEGTGSGLIFDTENQTAYIVTNQHVVDWSRTVWVTVNDSDFYEGQVLGRDATVDVAVVRICCGEFIASTFGDAAALDVGDDVLALGYAVDDLIPRNEPPKYVLDPVPATLTRGIVSAFRHDTARGTDLIQTDAPLNPGNSGGPLFSLDGLVVGINASSFLFLDGLSFAISEAAVQEQLPTLLASPPRPVWPPLRGTPTW